MFKIENNNNIPQALLDEWDKVRLKINPKAIPTTYKFTKQEDDFIENNKNTPSKNLAILLKKPVEAIELHKKQLLEEKVKNEEQRGLFRHYS